MANRYHVQVSVGLDRASQSGSPSNTYNVKKVHVHNDFNSETLVNDVVSYL